MRHVHVSGTRLVAACVAAAVLFAGGCDRQSAKAASAPAAKPTFGTFGFDEAGMDRSVAPGDDFDEYANGGWMKRTEIPSDRSAYDTFTLLNDEAESRTKGIITEAANNANATADVRKVGDFFSAFMDEAQIEKKGLAVKPDIEAIAAIRDKTALARAIGSTLRADVDLLNSTNFYTSHVFGLWASQDMDDSSTTSPYLVQGGLGMPDRDFYLDAAPRFADLRKKYTAHVAKILSLASVPDGEAKADRILNLETKIARVHASAVDTSDVRKGNNHWKRDEFPAKAPGLDWAAFFDGASLASQPVFVVWQPGAVTGISQLVASEPLDVWKAYLTFHAIDEVTALLPKSFQDEGFAFYGRELNGTPQQRDRWKRGVALVDGALGEAVGRIYAERYFPAASKARADQMVHNLMVAFGQRIDRLAWMSPESKAAAKRKLATLQIGLGYPSKWRDYSGLDIRRDDALGNVRRANLFEYRRNLAKLGKPADKAEWYLLPQEVNALNVPLENRLIFPAAILEPPFFDAAADDAVNYGAFGGVIGHEISHSFDSTGALFDENGKLHNWWTPSDFTRFEAAGAALAAQYDAYRPFADLSLNGKLELGENIADVAGLSTSYDAYRLSLGGKEAQALDGFTADQRFFLGWAQNYRSKFRERVLRNLVMTDVHAPGPYRTDTVRNLDAWYAAFNVTPGQKLYLAPDRRVKVW